MELKALDNGSILSLIERHLKFEEWIVSVSTLIIHSFNHSTLHSPLSTLHTPLYSISHNSKFEKLTDMGLYPVE